MPVTVKVRLRPGVTAFQASLNARSVTRRFRARASGLRVARIPRALMRRGRNTIAVRAGDRRGRRDFDFATVVVGRRTTSLLSLRPRRRGAPIRVAGVARLRARLRRLTDRFVVRLNGHRVRGALEGGRLRRGALAADDGLHFGRNRVEVVAWHRKGVWDAERRTVHVARSRPLPAAGPGRRVVAGRRVRLDGRRSRPTRRGVALSYWWRLVGRSPSRAARLIGRRRSRPVLVVRRPGRYRVALKVTERPRGARSATRPRVGVDATPVVAEPDLPPMGELLQAGGLRPNDGIALGDFRWEYGKPAPDGTQPNPDPANALHYLIVDRRTAEDVFYGVVVSQVGPPLPASGMEYQAAYRRMEKQLTDSGWDLRDLLWIAYGPPGCCAGELANDGFSEILYMGTDDGTGRPVGFRNRHLTTRAVPGTPGAVRGWLQKDNQGRYSFVQPEAVTLHSSFDSGQGYNVMRLSDGVAAPGADYKSQLLPDEGDDGFQLLALDRGTLAPLPNYPRKYGTNSSDSTRNGAVLSQLAADLKTALDADAFVVLQSIGKPRPSAPAWADVAAQLERLGASRHSFNTLDGTADPPDPPRHGGEYAVAGCAGCQQPAESSYPPDRVPGTGSVTALLRPAADYRYDLSLGDSGDLGEGITGYLPTQIAYQDPEPWPTWSGTGEQGEQQALAYITDQLAAKLGLDKDPRTDWCHRSPSRPLDLRDAYCGGTSPWPSDVESLVGFPQNKGFNQTEWNTVRQQLNLEFQYVNQARRSFDAITTVLSLAQGTSPRDVGQDIVEAIGGQTSSEVEGTGSEAMTAAMEVVSEVAMLFPEAEPVAVLVGIGAALMSAGGDTAHGTDGASELFERIQARADEFPNELTNNYIKTLDQIGRLHKLVVADWGKLHAFATVVKPDPDRAGDAAAARRVALTRFLWQEILPAAYGLVIFRPAPSLDQLKGLTCYAKPNNLNYWPFFQASDVDVWSPVDGFDAQMRPTSSSLHLMADGDYADAAVAFPPADLLTGVFERPGHTVDPFNFNPKTGPIIAKPTFFERADWRGQQTWDPRRCAPE